MMAEVASPYREFNFDGLVGPTHNYGGLAPGNVASMSHEGQASNPKLAALEGLRKMRLVHGLGVGQAVLPPHDRPSLRTLRQLGFHGTDEQMLAAAAAEGDHLLRLVSSAAAMWTANAATVAPSCDTEDGKLHVTPANLREMFHRSIEAEVTLRVLRAIFADPRRFVVHRPLPGGAHFADEGAANHTRLGDVGAGLHIFAWGRKTYGQPTAPRRFPARQTREASEALARLHRLPSDRVLFVQQHPDGIDAGAFHTDVLAVGTGNFFMMHDFAFVGGEALAAKLRQKVGSLAVEIASAVELPVEDAVRSYAFNSQLLAVSPDTMVLLAPAESRDNPRASAFLERVLAARNPVARVEYVDLRQSMQNGGGPACLRLRVPLSEDEAAALGARVLFSPVLEGELVAWVERHYRDRLVPGDLRDPQFARESFAALDELTRILVLGSVYDFQH